MSKRAEKLGAGLLGKLSAAPTPATAEHNARPATAPAERVELIPLGQLQRSDYQPLDRPSAASVARVEGAIAAAGGLDALFALPDEAVDRHLGPQGTPNRPNEARDLAELAWDIQQRATEGRGIGGTGIEQPLEARRLPDGRPELLSGHRRTAAAKLAGRSVAPVIDRGAMSDDEAAQAVVRRNLHRRDLTPWQEAVILGRVKEARLAAGQPAGVRDLARLMGYSTGRVSTLAQAFNLFAPEAATFGEGDPAAGDATLSRLTFSDLRELVGVEDAAARTRKIHLKTGLTARQSPDPASGQGLGAPGTPSPQIGAEASEPGLGESVVSPRRGGGYILRAGEGVVTLTVTVEPTPETALQLAKLLRQEATRLQKLAASIGKR